MFRSNNMKLFITCFVVSLSIKSVAQINIECLKLTDNTKNFLYVGVDNPIKVLMNNLQGNYAISINGGGSSLSKIGKGEYIVRVTTVDTCSITISQSQKEVFTKKFISNVIPYPVATLSGIHDTVVNKNRILANAFLSVVFPNCYYQHNLQVISFQAILIDGNDSTFTVTQGYRLNEEQIKLVKQLSSGGKIYFDGIRATGADSRTVKLESFWIKIE